MTTLTDLDGINSAGGGIVRQFRVLTLSDTLVSPCDGQLLVWAVAPGASGAAVNNATATQRLAPGGGAGEAAWDVIDVAKNDTFTVTLGAPGASVGPATSDGNNATNTTITGPNSYALMVEGGKRGVAVVGAATAPGGAGGAAGTGGTARVIRAPGGRGGNIANATGAAIIATSGGGVNAMMRAAQTGTRGGDSTSNTSGAVIATGGGSPGGHGGDRTGASTGSTGGAGAGGSAADNAITAGPNIRGDFVITSPADLFAALANYGIDYFGGGTDGEATTAAGPGGATGGRTGNGATGNAGNFASSGARATNSTSANVTPGSVGFGAGSPGCAAPSPTTLTVPAGGKSIVVAIFVES